MCRDAKSTLHHSKQISHKICDFIIFAILAIVIALFWNKEHFSPSTSCNYKLSMLSFCVLITMFISLTNSLGCFNSSEKVGDYSELNDCMMMMMNESKSECASVEDEFPADELKLICKAEDVFIHGKVGSFQEVQRSTDNHNNKKKKRDKCVQDSSELIVVEVPADNHTVNDKSELVEFNKRIDDFIAKFNRQIRLEARQTSSHYQQILPAPRYLKTV